MERLKFLRDHRGLVVLVLAKDQFDFVAFAVFGPEGLFLALEIVRDELVGNREDRLG